MFVDDCPGCLMVVVCERGYEQEKNEMDRVRLME